MSQPLQIASLALINQNSLQINLAKSWYQEDITELTLSILSFLTDHHVIETTSGADRQYCRFEWQQDYFIINFEYYGQSCWIENETTPNITLLTLMKNTLLNR